MKFNLTSTFSGHPNSISGCHKDANAGSFRPDIEGLRGFAVLIVVLFHARIPGFSGGFVGVDVFFVLSGYLITGLLIAEWDAKGHIDLLRFFARRVARLLPAATLTILATVTAARMLLSPVEQVQVARSAVRAALYFSNVSFARNLDYFEGLADEDALLHTWSLAVEEQYYLVWPVIIIFSAYLGALRTRFRRAELFVMVTLVSFAWCQWQMQTAPPSAFFLMPGRAWEFAVGGLVRIAPLGVLPLFPLRAVSGMVGLFLIVGSAIGLSDNIPYPGLAVLLPVIGTAAILFAGAITPTTGTLCALGTTPMRWLGKVSYSWYLWHWPALALALLVSTASPVVSRVAACAISLVLATFCFHFVESPLRRLGQAWPRHGVVVALGLTLSISSALICEQMSRRAANDMREPHFVSLESMRVNRPKAVDDCQLPYLMVEPRPCHFGSAASTRQVWLVGDSKATRWVPALDALGREYGWSVTLLSKGGCPIEELPDFYLPKLRRVYYECAQWRREVLALIRVQKPSLIIVAASKNYVIGATAVVGLDEWESAATRTYRTLLAGGSELIVLRDTPSFTHNIPDCLGRPGADADGGVRCGVGREAAAPTSLHERTLHALAAAGGGHAVDLTDFFCDPNYCPPLIQGWPSFTDADHMTATLSNALAPMLGRAIVDAIPSLVLPPSMK